MATEELQLGTDDPVLGEMGDELMAEEMWVDALFDARRAGVLRDQLPQPPGRVGTVPLRFKEIGRSLAPLAFHILGQLAAHTQREQDLPILVAFPLHNPQVPGMHIDIREAELY